MIFRGLFLLILVFADSSIAKRMKASSMKSNPIKLTGCTQSSTKYKGNCKRALDGNTNQNWYKNSCSHTGKELGWWKAHAEKQVHIKSVTIVNRKDCCSERLNNFAILVDGKECASYKSNKTFSVKTFKCDKVGREVMIKNRKKGYLTLCEVKVTGTVIQQTKKQVPKRHPPQRPKPHPKKVHPQARRRPTVSHAKPVKIVRINLTGCTQSSTKFNGKCNRAIDNNLNQDWRKNSCSHTNKERGWWKARATHKVQIRAVRIFNRKDCCSERLNDFAILVDGKECASYKSTKAFFVKTFNCNKVGREVMIKNRKNGYLTLCEVRVFGTVIHKSHRKVHKQVHNKRPKARLQSTFTSKVNG